MKPDMPQSFHEALALHMILQSGCDVNAGDIFVMPSKIPAGDDMQLGVFVIEGGKQIYGAACGRIEMSDEEFRKRWPEAVIWLKTLSDTEAKEFRDSAKIREHAVEIMAAVILGRNEASREMN